MYFVFTFLQNCGNVLKVDRHKYVKVGYHGFRLMSAQDRKSMYNSGHQVSAPFRLGQIKLKRFFGIEF
jgi:hypothetical protein